MMCHPKTWSLLLAAVALFAGCSGSSEKRPQGTGSGGAVNGGNDGAGNAGGGNGGSGKGGSDSGGAGSGGGGSGSGGVSGGGNTGNPCVLFPPLENPEGCGDERAILDIVLSQNLPCDVDPALVCQVWVSPGCSQQPFLYNRRCCSGAWLSSASPIPTCPEEMGGAGGEAGTDAGGAGGAP